MRSCLFSAVLLVSFAARPAERWELQYFYDKNDSSLSFVDLAFPSSTHGIGAGVIFEARRQKPVVALTSDGGGSWNLVPVKETPLSIHFLDERTGWMVTVRGLWATSDGGQTWVQKRLSRVQGEPIRVYFRDPSRGWLLCTRGLAYETSDGGQTWSSIEASAGPEAKEKRSAYSQAATLGKTVLLSGFTRPDSPKSRLPQWMEPDLAALGVPPSSAFVLQSQDGGAHWTRHALPDFGEVKRLWISSSGLAYALVHHLESLVKPTEIVSLDPASLRTRSLYGNKSRWITDVALAGPNRLIAAAIDQEGRSPHASIPAKLRVLSSADGRVWNEMEVDYRAEARTAVLAACGAGHAWLATDTGMILHWAKE